MMVFSFKTLLKQEKDTDKLITMAQFINEIIRKRNIKTNHTYGPFLVRTLCNLNKRRMKSLLMSLKTI